MEAIEPTSVETFTIGAAVGRSGREAGTCWSNGSMAFVTVTTPKTVVPNTSRSVASVGRLIVYCAEPGSPTDQAFKLLAQPEAALLPSPGA